MYFRIQYLDNGEEAIVRLNQTTMVGKKYRFGNEYGCREFKVLSEAKLKYTMNDIGTLIVMLEGYEDGVFHKLYKRLCKIWDKGVPILRLSSTEKDNLGYLYYESDMLTEHEEAVLKKALDIKE